MAQFLKTLTKWSPAANERGAEDAAQVIKCCLTCSRTLTLNLSSPEMKDQELKVTLSSQARSAQEA